ncbi:MAG: amino acid ABC transporter permease [Tenericutes bacterium HGW-Tenericutes-2]|jgi:polar amino acid transport system permease protein|nr:MAG: amino acid ABC transporter permease [Tenericutes bacterium HGW-Tenericutes-2]PKL00378.1 MAG: amino acid ABC transporter permease [Tenericutes bacterium HGW-Tenericutes-1]
MDYLLEVAQYLTKGAFVSLSVFLVTLVFSFPIGLILSMLQRKNKIIKRAISIYTWFFRGTPLMLQLFFFMYGLPFIGINVNRMMVAFIAFVINYSAYFVEIIRAGIESLPKDQFESASMMGATSYQTYRHIILPQAIRIQFPVISSEVITLIKDTALVTVIAITDLMRGVKEIVSRDFTISPFILASAFYLLISYVIVKLFKRLEKRFDYLELN